LLAFSRAFLARSSAFAAKATGATDAISDRLAAILAKQAKNQRGICRSR
jgi:hypothetical protein